MRRSWNSPIWRPSRSCSRVYARLARARHVETRHDCITRTILRQIVRRNERNAPRTNREVTIRGPRQRRRETNSTDDSACFPIARMTLSPGLFVPIARTRPVDHTLNLARLADRARRDDVYVHSRTKERKNACARRRRLEYTHCTPPSVLVAVNAD